jgi:Derlin-2/3
VIWNYRAVSNFISCYLRAILKFARMDLGDAWSSLPVITRWYATLVVGTSILCALDVVSPFYLYFNSRLIWYKHEWWRLITNFLYMGEIGIDFVFHLFFLVRYCRSLEEQGFRNRSADFLWLLVFGMIVLTLLATVFPVKVQFLGISLNFMLTYIWSRRNPHVPMSFFGVFTFGAAYLPFVLMAFSILIGGSPMMDVLGLVAGHLYYYLEDVYPRTAHGQGRRPLKTPRIFVALMSGHDTARIRRI